jgi:hypothetical protein
MVLQVPLDDDKVRTTWRGGNFMYGEAEEISERLALVEKSMRRYRAALAAVTVIAVAALAVGSPLVGAAKAPEVIQAKNFEVVDNNGRVSASLANAGDLTSLAFFDKTGKPRASLGNIGDATYLAIYDNTGKTTRVALSTTGNYASLRFNDEAGKMRAVLGNGDLKLANGSTEHREVSSLVLLNEQGNVLWKAP